MKGVRQLPAPGLGELVGEHGGGVKELFPVLLGVGLEVGGDLGETEVNAAVAVAMRATLSSPSDPLVGVDDFGHADAEVLVNDDNFPARDQPVVHQDVDGISGKLVQLDDRAVAQRKHVLDRQLLLPKLHIKRLVI